ncbi:MAG: hypothetical protein ACFCUX_02360 [Candidatus Methylacidiphilales bacterium]
MSRLSPRCFFPVWWAAVLACLALCIEVTWVHAADDGVRKKEEATPFGRHPVLTADMVMLEFKIDPTRTGVENLQNASPVAETWNQQLALVQTVTPSENLTIQQTVGMGLSKRSEGFDAELAARVEERWQQVQNAEISLHTQEKSVSLKLHEQYRVLFHGDASEPESLWRVGADLETRPLKNLTWSSRWFNEEKSTSTSRRGMVEHLGTRLNWKADSSTKLQPEVYHERQLGSEGRETGRNAVGFTVVRGLMSNRLSVEAKPFFIREEADPVHRIDQSIRRLETSASWSPDQQWTLKMGNQLQERLQTLQDRRVSETILYSSVNHRPYEEFNILLRGDYRHQLEQSKASSIGDSEQSRLSLGLMPEVQLSEQLVAAGGYQIHVTDPNGGGNATSEQTLTFSLRGAF